MPKINRTAIESLEDGENKNLLLSLFDEIVEKEKEVENFRQKAPKDSEEIVSKTDHATYKKAVKELSDLKNKFTGNVPDSADESLSLDFLSDF